MVSYSYTLNIPHRIFELPINVSDDYDYYQELDNRFSNYIKFVDSLKNNNNILEETLGNVKENMNLIKESLSNYHNGDLGQAKNNILKLLKKYEKNNTIIGGLNESYACRALATKKELQYSGENYSEMEGYRLSFFKARIGNNNFKRKDMLHIPFNHRELVSTQRFSIPGIPCMYLGTTSYVCWLEMGKAKDTEFNVSSFELPLGLRIIDLTMSDTLFTKARNQIHSPYWNSLKEYEKNLYLGRIEFWPLICATSFTVNEENRKFKSEYIISQLIMQCLSDLKIDGIAYLSKKARQGIIAYPQCVNIAIPMINKNGYINKEDIFSEVAQKCKLTKPVNLAEYMMLKNDNKVFNKSYINYFYPEGNQNAAIEFAGNIIDYQKCVFSDFDNYLVNLHHDSYFN